jgi:hypothetical protein
MADRHTGAQANTTAIPMQPKNSEQAFPYNVHGHQPVMAQPTAPGYAPAPPYFGPPSVFPLLPQGLPPTFPFAAPTFGAPLPLGTIVEMDVDAMRGMPPLPGGTAGAAQVLVPRPLVWIESSWVTKPFVVISTRYEDEGSSRYECKMYQCQLHRFDGQRCLERVEDQNSTSIMNHLLTQHGIIAPRRPKRRWQTGLLDGICTTTACDCLLMPFCFESRMNSLQFQTTTDATPSYNLSALGCDGSADCGDSCCSWMVHTPFICIFVVLLPFLAFVMVPCVHAEEFRRQIVALHNIDESECATRAIVWCCCPCSHCQMHNEIAAVGVWPGLCCFARQEPLPSPAEVQSVYKALTRETVVRSRYPQFMPPMPAAIPVMGVQRTTFFPQPTVLTANVITLSNAVGQLALH